MAPINPGRRLVADAFRTVVLNYLGRGATSEVDLQTAWMEEIAAVPLLTTNGWYVPPKGGSVVLTCISADVSRSRFKSFRDPTFFASDKPINWSDSILIAYASNVDLRTGIPADFATTIYFGTDPKVRDYLGGVLCRLSGGAGWYQAGLDRWRSLQPYRHDNASACALRQDLEHNRR